MKRVSLNCIEKPIIHEVCFNFGIKASGTARFSQIPGPRSPGPAFSTNQSCPTAPSGLSGNQRKLWNFFLIGNLNGEKSGLGLLATVFLYPTFRGINVNCGTSLLSKNS